MRMANSTGAERRRTGATDPRDNRDIARDFGDGLGGIDRDFDETADRLADAVTLRRAPKRGGAE